MRRPEIEDLFRLLQTTLDEDKSPARFADDCPVYIYGAGNVGKDIFRLLRGQGILIAGFLDRNAKPDSVWQDVPVLRPDSFTISRAQRERSLVVIGIFNRDTEMPPIVDFLKNLGYGKITSFLDFHDQFPTELNDRFWLTSRSFYLNQKENILAGNEIWSDELSRDLYKAVLEFRFTKSYGILPQPSGEDQYFPKGLPAWPNPVRFVDCGAFDGDTIRQLLDSSAEVEAIAAFEPDPANFSKLVQTVRSRAAGLNGTLSLFPCGVSSETSQIRFSIGHGEASCASEAGEMMIQCVSLDDALAGFRPSVIKMDIEGAECDALWGARRIIEQYRPGLAISVYHRADHLWVIPLLIRSWLKGGHHYLRMHAYNGFDLIYYWMP